MTGTRRPWFQFHLSTAVVLMFVAGGLMWANMTKSVVMLSRPAESFGWPVPFLIYRVGMKGDVYQDWYHACFVLDALLALCILLLCALSCEYLLRRRERRP